MKRFVVSITAAGLAATALAAAPRQPTATQEVYVTVAAPDGRLVPGLSAEAFHVRENGVSMPVVGAEPADGPLDVAVIANATDDWRTEAQDVRNALGSVVNVFSGSRGGARVALITSAVAPTFVELPVGEDELHRSASTVFDTEGLPLFDMVGAATRALARQPAGRHAVLAIENGIGTPETGQAVDMADHLREAGASLWVVQYTPGFGVQPARVDSQRDLLVSSVTLATGGDRDIIVGTSALASAATRLAHLLLAQYVVTYERPAGAAPARLEVGVTAPSGTTVLAPQWTPK